MKITPELIPHAEFHRGRWLLPVERPSWYYFMKREDNHKITNREFLASVDEPLRELVKFLHERGIKTTPSCSGHHISERDLKKIYQDLEKDRDDILGEGLKLKDIETRELYAYRNKDYALPWRKDDFIEKVEEYQQHGVLGIRLNHEEAKKQILDLHVPGAMIKEKDSILFIHTHANGDGSIKHIWEEITGEIKGTLRNGAIQR